MKLHRLTPTELVEFAENLAAVLGGTELPAMDSNVRLALLAAIGTIPAEIAAKSAEAEALKSRTHAAYAARDDLIAALLPVCRAARDSLKAGGASKHQFELTGFDFVNPAAQSTYIAKIPSDLAVEGFSNGVNKGRFIGNNRSSAVLYEIWRRNGKEAEWALCMAVRPPHFIDENVIPGRYYEYKVRARAAKTVSLFSNSASVYGPVKF